MHWYYYFSDLLAGMLLANFVPHFIKGTAGDPFPTPFAKPPGKGLSSPLVNVLWAMFNLIVGFLLFRFGKVSVGDTLSISVFFIGIACISIFSAINFVHKDKV
ncbi:hypothetical protein DCC81_04030 [Chitinophaga parva]|uniref:Uncharacterized protein n=1 Tax=Chitinophaga parva TaxID=2169414 RepID=A0A2T7BM16_9BACT|nr:hypothetical protein [Chitinophaga parva]PUZ28661.1 hypothetical protein DCC81_04030 [Chitinophaga parva]